MLSLTQGVTGSLDTSAFPSGFWDGSCSPVTIKQAEVAPSARTSDKAVNFSSWNAKSLALLGSHQSQTLPSQALPERESSFQPSKERSPSFLPRLCGPTQGGNEAKPDKCPFRLVWLHLCDLPAPFPAPLWHCPWRVFLQNNHQTRLTTAGK